MGVSFGFWGRRGGEEKKGREGGKVRKRKRKGGLLRSSLFLAFSSLTRLARMAAYSVYLIEKERG